jgi:hypothetical protein
MQLLQRKNTIQDYLITPHVLEVLTQYCSLNNEFTVTATQAVPPAARSMSHLRYLELAGNPIMTLNNVSFQGAMEHLRELDIRHVTLNHFEVKQLILFWGPGFQTTHSHPVFLHTCIDTSRLSQDDHSISSFCLFCTRDSH